LLQVAFSETPIVIIGKMRKEDTIRWIPDEHFGLRPSEMAEFCPDLAYKLRFKGVIRSSAERLKLALDCAAILVRIAEKLTGGYADAQGPERVATLSGTVRQAFMEWVQDEAAATRQRAS
jgi:hypothetical protein